ncbi:velvet factor, partial [Chytridium lagenaria]
IRQQPVRARMCGFSDTKDRRLIDPPPILQLFFKNGSERIALSPRECTTLVCHASLWSPNGKEERNIVVNPRGSGEGGEVGDKDDLKPVPIDKLSVNESRLCQALVGSLATPCMILNDVDGTEGMFFVFYDLSVRTQGSFRLKFHLIDADSTKEFSAAKSVLWTNVFEVYSPKTFPGMTGKTFAKQGLPIHIRKDYSTSKEQSTAQTPLDLD